MFSLKNKLAYDLKKALDYNIYKYYRVLIHYKSLQKNIEKKILSHKCKVLRLIPSCSIIAANLTAHSIERLIELPEVNYILFDTYGFLCGNSVRSANGVRFTEKYNLTGRGIGIGLIDSGVYPHTDLINPTNKVRLFVDLINGYKYPYDDHGHGTFISGVICGNGSISKGQYKGIAENAHICCYKAFNSKGRAFVSDILYSIEALIEQSKEHNIRILCLPFEIFDYDSFINYCFSILFDKAINENIIPVLPSGSNENYECSMRGPAILTNCITVGGIDTSRDRKAYKYSSAGPIGKIEKPNMVAACVDVISLNSNTKYIPERNGSKIYPTSLEEPYTTYSGTSCSAAYVSGLISLLLENNNSLSYKDILSLLKVSSNLIDIPKSIQGSGVVDINKLLP